MSRYIDINAIPNIYTATHQELVLALEDAPTIDIVRCKECRWLDKGENESCSWSMCTRHFGQYINVNADDFCSYGDKRDD